MELILICSPPALWYISKNALPRVSKLFGVISILFGVVLTLNIINSI